MSDGGATESRARRSLASDRLELARWLSRDPYPRRGHQLAESP